MSRKKFLGKFETLFSKRGSRRSEMNKICIIYTGGTIGMTRTEKGYAPKKGFLGEMLEKLPELSDSRMPKWDMIEMSPLLDSSNMTVYEWNKIAEKIYENYGKYDGFVVLHGTDTMAYTASALSFMLEGLAKPVVLTGSQIPIGKARSDARENIITSLIIAGDGKCPEVTLFFGGKLMRGNRATKISADEMIAFSSPNFPDLANAAIDIRYRENLIRPAGKKLQVTHFSDDLPIAVLKIFPGIHFELFEGIMTDKLKGLVLEGFGVGNIPQTDEGLIPIVRKAVQNGTVITVCTQCLRGCVRLGAYATSRSLNDAGAVSGYDMTVEAAVTKLYYLFAKGYDNYEIRHYMESDLRGELTCE